MSDRVLGFYYLSNCGVVLKADEQALAELAARRVEVVVRRRFNGSNLLPPCITGVVIRKDSDIAGLSRWVVANVIADPENEATGDADDKIRRLGVLINELLELEGELREAQLN